MNRIPKDKTEKRRPHENIFLDKTNLILIKGKEGK
jgi:hypothetical protein